MIPAPRANPALIGHRAAESTLLRAARERRLHHAWLLAGPRGIGKATLAFRFARWLLAGAPPSLDDSLDLAPEHPVFRQVAAGTHPDLTTVEREVNEKTGKRRGEITVDTVRSLGSFLRLTPASGGWRVVVIDSADELNANAANAALKLLEEPPDRAILLMVCHAPTRILPTLRSRCRRLNLRPLPRPDLDRFIRANLPDATDPGGLADLAEGSPGEAVGLAEEGAPALLGEIEAVLDWTRPDVAALHDLADRLARAGGDGPGGLGFCLLQRTAEARARRPATTRTAGGASWVAAWDRIGQLARQTDGLNLDRKHAILAGLAALSDAGSPTLA